MSESIRWGILGTGRIARQFANGLRGLPEAKLAAIGSRSPEKAQAFGKEFCVSNCHPSYEALTHDPAVDVVYVATPHSLHKENTLLALEAGKAVLCEKPLTINAREAGAIIETARRKRLFLMEVMWTRFFPLMTRLRELVGSDAIGQVRLLTADFGFRAEVRAEGRLFNRAFGGGSLLDVGIYPVSLASMIFGPPKQITSQAHLGETGVDEEAAVILGYPGGQLAQVSSAIRANTPQEALLVGTKGSIRIHSPWWRPTVMTLRREQDRPRAERHRRLRIKWPWGRPLSLCVSLSTGCENTLEFPLDGNGYQYEATEVMRCLREGRLESPIMPLDESLAIMKTLDTIRAQWNLKYPME